MSTEATREGYCTVDDVKRVMQKTDVDFDGGALGANQAQITVDAIAGLTEFIDIKTQKHWYVPDGVTEDTHGLIPTGPKSRDDEEDIPTGGADVDGVDRPRRYRNANSDALLESGRLNRQSYYGRDRTRRERPKRRIRLAFGDWRDTDLPGYTRIRLARKDVTALNELLVVNAEGGFDDWTGVDYDGGIGNANRGKDWWVRVNDLGFSELYLDIHAMDDRLASLSKGVYVDFEYGQADLNMTVRRGVAHLAAADLIIDDEFQAGLPDNGQLINVETKSERWERRGKELLARHWIKDPDQVVG